MADDDRPLFDAQELEVALAAAGVGIWGWEVASNRIRWSAQTAQLAGLPARSLEGSLDDFLQSIHPEDRARAQSTIQTAVANVAQGGPRDWELQYRIQQPTGDVRHVRARGRMRVDARCKPVDIVGAIYDITDQRLTEERYRLFTELASDYVYDADATQLNAAPTIVAGSFERTTGYRPEDLEALGGWFGVMHPEDRDNATKLLTSLQVGRAVVHEYRIRTKHGEERWLRDRVYPVLDPETGQLARVFGGVQDITERKTLEMQLAHAKKLEALARMAGSVAHDFNNLLTVMMGATELIDMDAEGTRLETSLAELRRAQARAAELTGSLLAFARRRPTRRLAVPVRQALEEARRMLDSAVGEQVSLELVHGVEDARVMIDRGEFEMALLNLAVNARDAMPDGGRLRIETRISDFAESDTRRPPDLASGPHVVIEVSDTGTGLDVAVMPHIFEPFFSTKDGEGTGLGLSTVHGIVHQMGGTILADNIQGGGARFTLLVPLATGDAAPPAASEARHSVGGQERLVVVDDDPRVRGIMTSTLLDLGYRVSAFESAEAALADSAALSRCDLLVSDVRLPGMAGTDLAERCVAERPGLPVLLTSGYVEEAAQAALIETGRFAFLQKPFKPSGLAARVREVLDASAHPPCPTTPDPP